MSDPAEVAAAEAWPKKEDYEDEERHYLANVIRAALRPQDEALVALVDYAGQHIKWHEYCSPNIERINRVHEKGKEALAALKVARPDLRESV